MDNIDEDMALALELADVARQVIGDNRDAFKRTVIKDDGSPVTQADLECERGMRELLAQRAAGDAVWGEELGRQTGRRQWVLDPLDGTKAFVSGSPLYCTLIGLVVDGVPTTGVIEAPALRRRWAASRGRGHHWGEGSTTPLDGLGSKTTDLSMATLAMTCPPKSLAAKALADAVAVVRYGGDAFNFASVSSGTLDLAIDEGLQPHDFVALVPVVQAAGGRACDFDGASLDPRRPSDLLTAGNPELCARAVETMSRATA